MAQYQFGGELALPPEQLFYRANVRRQKGYGLGGIFGTIARYILPFAKTYILPHAKQAVKNIASDVLTSNVPLKQALKMRSVGALKSIGRHVLIGQTGSGRKKPRSKRKPSKKKGRKKRDFVQRGQGRKNPITKRKKKKKSKSKKNAKLKTIFDRIK